MATNTLNILKPSVNNLTVRIFVRAAGLDYEEVDVWGQTTTPEYLAKYPAHLTPMLEEEGLPQGALGESCAIMAYLSNKHGLEQFYPSDPGRRAMIGGRRRAEGEGAEGCRGGARGAARGLQRLLPCRKAVHRRRPPLDRRHPLCRDARVPARHRLRPPAVGRGLHGAHGGQSWRGVFGAGGRRARLRGVRERGRDRVKAPGP
jgi:hypothetical protein